MTVHQGLPVAGYQPQTAAAVALVNGNKAIEEEILRVMDEMQVHSDFDKRWLAIDAAGMIVKGFLALNRAVFRPGRVRLPQDGAE